VSSPFDAGLTDPRADQILDGGSQSAEASPMRSLRPLVASLELFVALVAMIGGGWLLSGPNALPREWLRGGPFDDFTGPGIVLVLFATLMSIAAMTLALRWRYAPLLSTFAGVLVMAFAVAQLATVGLLNWAQPATLIIGAALAWMSRELHNDDGARWTGDPRRRPREAY
jgi:hypothetical protein